MIVQTIVFANEFAGGDHKSPFTQAALCLMGEARLMAALTLILMGEVAFIVVAVLFFALTLMGETGLIVAAAFTFVLIFIILGKRLLRAGRYFFEFFSKVVAKLYKKKRSLSESKAFGIDKSRLATLKEESLKLALNQLETLIKEQEDARKLAASRTFELMRIAYTILAALGGFLFSHVLFNKDRNTDGHETAWIEIFIVGAVLLIGTLGIRWIWLARKSISNDKFGPAGTYPKPILDNLEVISLNDAGKEHSFLDNLWATKLLAAKHGWPEEDERKVTSDRQLLIELLVDKSFKFEANEQKLVEIWKQYHRLLGQFTWGMVYLIGVALAAALLAVFLKSG